MYIVNQVTFELVVYTNTSHSVLHKLYFTFLKHSFFILSLIYF